MSRVPTHPSAVIAKVKPLAHIARWIVLDHDDVKDANMFRVGDVNISGLEAIPARRIPLIDFGCEDELRQATQVGLFLRVDIDPTRWRPARNDRGTVRQQVMDKSPDSGFLLGSEFVLARSNDSNIQSKGRLNIGSSSVTPHALTAAFALVTRTVRKPRALAHAVTSDTNPVPST